VAEEDKVSKLKFLIDSVDYIFVEQKENFFYRTRLLNMMIKRSNTPFICNYDCDILLKPEQYINGINMLRTKKFSMVYPHYSNIQISRALRNSIKQKLNIGLICAGLKNKRDVISYGCCNMVNKVDYIKAGMENENFKSWGPEDYERYTRMIKLGYKVGRLNWEMSFHLEHSRGVDSGKSNPYFEHNEQEYEKIKKMNRLELEKYIKTWSWTKI